jgi:hypothetical protein
MAAHSLRGISQRHIRGAAPLTLRTQRLRKSGPDRQATERISHALSAFAERASAGSPAGPCPGRTRADSRAVAAVPGNAAQLLTAPHVPDMKSPLLNMEAPNL